MKTYNCICLLFGLLFLSISQNVLSQNKNILNIGNEKWQATIDGKEGKLISYRQYLNHKWEYVPFRTDSMGGIAFEGVQLHPAKEPFSFCGKKGDIEYQLSYKKANDHLIVRCSVANRGKSTYTPERLRLILGINSEMHSYPDWDKKFFPTLLRCEKNFAWGYFMSPRQVVFGVGVEEPVASYGLNYIYEGIKQWTWGHQILTASLDLLHCLPLPARHPQNLTSLPDGETRNWTLHLGCTACLSSLKKDLSKWIKAPMLEADRYVLSPGESARVSICCPHEIRKLMLSYPDGTSKVIPTQKVSKGFFHAAFVPGQKGIYRLDAEDSNGKISEGQLYVREPWSWYLEKARDFVAKNPPFFGSSCETFYGYYAAFLGARYFPDKREDDVLEGRFQRTLPLIIDTATGFPRCKEVLPKRVQNFSSLTGILVDLWKATGKLEYLVEASRVGDYLCSDSIQWADGSYRSGKVDYSAVIYPAKSMWELASAEKILSSKNEIWKQRYERHSHSAIRAANHLSKFLDNIETEGDMTFEDGMVNCSALQMALTGLNVEDREIRNRYAEASRYMMNKHQCLEQLQIPDCRMRGATLRFWEALDIYFSPNQVMDSPHGWTAWKIYALYYLYLLTGEEHYLSDFMDTLGACIQVMDLNGHLRWGFIPDPYVNGRLCVPKTGNLHDWQTKDSIVGEQYLEMISPWLRPDNENSLCFFGGRGGSGDNTVYEIFKAMEECALTTSYVVVEKDKRVKTWNCSAKWGKDGSLCVIPAEKIIERIQLNCMTRVDIKTVLSGKSFSKKQFKGMAWLGKTPDLITK